MGYLEKIEKLNSEGFFKDDKFYNVTVTHVDDCPALKGGICNCDPDLLIEEVSPKQ